MKFRDLLNESFWKSVQIYQKPVDIFKNPTRNEVNEILKTSQIKEIRGGVYKNNIYAWDSFKMDHGGVQTHYNFRFDWVFIYNRNRKHVEVYGVSNKANNEKEEQKIYDRLKLVFGAKTIR